MTSPPERLRIIVSGYIARYPLGGVTWDYLQYPLGLLEMGHDVYYFEDSGQWPYDPQADGLVDDYGKNLAYLADVMARFGLSERWACRFPFDSRWNGLRDVTRAEVLRTADLVINVSGSLSDISEYRGRARLLYIDSDPVFTQIKLLRGQAHLRRLIDAHDRLFSFGERLSDPSLDTGHHWLPTRQPVVLREWSGSVPPRDTFTTVMNWTSYNEIEHEGRRYGQKDEELMRFLKLPSLVKRPLELAVNTGKTRRAPRELLEHNGWHVVNPLKACPGLDSYRDYVRTSFGEWSVAKGGYVSGQPAWFSCRSACYLASGRPVIVQDTGITGVLPVGLGIVTFRTLEEAAEAIDEVAARYDVHAAKAREIACEYFDSAGVLAGLVERAAGNVASPVEART
jgi:hypothetical protein